MSMLLRWNIDHLDLLRASEALRGKVFSTIGVGSLGREGATVVTRSRALSSSLPLLRDSFVAELSVCMSAKSLDNCI
jgi:hypothetical protein